jgi:hypothetical protein
MRNEHILYKVTLNAVEEKMIIRICGEIDEQIAVHKRLRARADIFSAEPSRFLAVFAVTEYGRHALNRRSTQKLKFHNIFPFFLIFLIKKKPIKPSAPMLRPKHDLLLHFSG